MTVTICSWCGNRGRAPAMRHGLSAWMPPREAARVLSELAASNIFPERSHALCPQCAPWTKVKPSLVRRVWWRLRKIWRAI